ncbi:MAG: hypothetical protein ACK5JH_12985 [Anaerocolumna sp.]
MMIEMDLEDYLEEVKFQMTEWDKLTDDMIFEWEFKAREWVDKHNSSRIKKHGENVTLLLKDEDYPQTLARLYYRAKCDNSEVKYWNDFQLFK